MLLASFRMAGVTLFVTFRSCLVTCRKSFLCGRGNTFASFATFSEDALQYIVSYVSFPGRRSTLDVTCASPFFCGSVVLRVFCEFALSGLRQVATRCKFRGKHCIL